MIRKLLRINLSTLTVLSFCIGSAEAQIIIDQTDMPVVNDTFRLSTGAPNPLMDPSTTGANHVWDYSWMVPFVQNVDTFKSVTSTGALYAFFFMNNGSNVNRANLATKGPDFPAVPGLSITNVLSFMYNSTASYKQVGIGANINGNGVPIAYSPHDIVYKFPMNYGNIDSSNSAFNISLPGLGYYGYSLKRHNEVDGWGTLTTPYGTFQTLRVKSTLIQKDTLYIDSLATGFAMDRPLTIEYKWLADNKGIPLLTIVTQDGFPGPVVTNMTYRDSARNLGTSTNENPEKQNLIRLYPNPTDRTSSLDIINEGFTELEIRIFDLQGKELQHFVNLSYPSGQSRVILDANSMGLSSGLYFINVKLGSSYQSLKWLLTESAY